MVNVTPWMNDKTLATVEQEVEKIKWVWIQLAQVPNGRNFIWSHNLSLLLSISQCNRLKSI